MARLLSLLCCWLLISTAAATEKSHYYIAVSDDNFLPYAWIEDGVMRGADRALLDAFAKQQQLKLIYLPLPRPRALELMRTGVVDLIYPDNPSWAKHFKQGMAVSYSDYGMSNHAGFFRPLDAQCAAEISSIGTLVSWTPTGFGDRIASGEVKVQRFATLEQLLEAGRTGLVDAIFSERYFLSAHIEREPRYQVLEFCTSLPSSRGNMHLSTSRHPEVLAKFNQFLKAQPEVIQEIRKRYRLP